MTGYSETEKDLYIYYIYIYIYIYIYNYPVHNIYSSTISYPGRWVRRTILGGWSPHHFHRLSGTGVFAPYRRLVTFLSQTNVVAIHCHLLFVHNNIVNHTITKLIITIIDIYRQSRMSSILMRRLILVMKSPTAAYPMQNRLGLSERFTALRNYDQ